MRAPRRRMPLTLGAAMLLALAAGAGGPARAEQDPPPASGQTPPPAAQAPPATQTPQTPIFRTGVNYVRVDVIVTDKSGAPVGDLKPEDFEVTESGTPQKIETFKLISLDGGLMAVGDDRPQDIRTDAMEENEAARDDVRLFAVFLDDYHVKRDSSIRAREQLARFIETQIGPSDMVGIMYPLQAVAGVRMTRSHDAVRRAILGFQGRKYDYKPTSPEEERYVSRVSAETVERMRNQASFGAIKSLIMRLGGLKEGRKSLILVSEGYSNTLPLELQGYYGGMSAGPNLADTPRPGAGLSVPTGRDAFEAMNISIDLQDIYNLANRNNVSIYTVDPRGLATAEFGLDLPAVDRSVDRQYLNMTMDTLRSLAENTDGRAVVNRNDLTVAMKQVVVDSSAYYLLGYNSTITTADGKFHEITVKVKRPGVQVRHRNGYWALKPEEATRLATPVPARVASAVETAIEATAVPRSRIVRTWIGTERGENGATRVTFVWEPSPRPGQSTRESDRPVRVTLTAAGPDGPMYFRGRVPDGAPLTAGASAGAKVSFDARPGRMQLRLSVEGPGADVLDSEVREIVVPDLTSPQTTFGTPGVFRARSLPELQRLRTDANPVPVVAREFSRTERLLVRVPVYGPAGAAPVVTAALLNRAGQPMGDLPVAPPEAGRSSSQVEVMLANLSPGEYAVAFSATSAGGDAQELVAFRLTP